MKELYVIRPEHYSLKPLTDYIEIDNGVMVEVGSFAGESAVYFAISNKFREIHCIDPWVNHYDDTVELSRTSDFDWAEECFDIRVAPFPFVKKLKGISKEKASLFDNSSLDLVYIDANHAYEFVKEDISLWLPKIKIGGYIAGHDYETRDGVAPAVKELLGTPDKVFPDTSWIVRVK